MLYSDIAPWSGTILTKPEVNKSIHLSCRLYSPSFRAACTSESMSLPHSQTTAPRLPRRKPRERTMPTPAYASALLTSPTTLALGAKTSSATTSGDPELSLRSHSSPMEWFLPILIYFFMFSIPMMCCFFICCRKSDIKNGDSESTPANTEGDQAVESHELQNRQPGPVQTREAPLPHTGMVNPFADAAASRPEDIPPENPFTNDAEVMAENSSSEGQPAEPPESTHEEDMTAENPFTDPINHENEDNLTENPFVDAAAASLDKDSDVEGQEDSHGDVASSNLNQGEVWWNDRESENLDSAWDIVDNRGETAE